MSQIIEAITGMMEVVADNPSSILIVLGFLSIMIAVFIPIGASLQFLVGGMGVLMLIGGVALNVLWLGNGR
jgi:hypothetical protein